jgi:hypothetical protein
MSFPSAPAQKRAKKERGLRHEYRINLEAAIAKGLKAREYLEN